MTLDEKRIKLAEALGFTEVRMSDPWQVSDPPDDRIVLCGNWRGQVRPLQVPDYFASLDAVHAACEQALRETDLWERYVADLVTIYWGGRKYTHGYPYSRLEVACACLRASAEQKSNALGYTLGLWQD